MASVDRRYELSGVVVAEEWTYHIDRHGLVAHLVPKKPQDITVASLHQWGKAIPYTKAPFAHLSPASPNGSLRLTAAACQAGRSSEAGDLLDV